MKYLIAIFMLVICSNSLAQESPSSQIKIEIKDFTSGASERSMIAWSCTQIANIAVAAHAKGELTNLINEVAKMQRTGSSSDPLLSAIIEKFKFDPNGNFLFSALFLSQLNIAYLDEDKGPYRNDLNSLYIGYLSASCASLAKFTPDSRISK